MWEDQFDYSERVYEWAYQYQQHDMIRMPMNYFFDNIGNIFDTWIQKRFKNINMMSNYVGDRLRWGQEVPLSLCQKATYEVAKAFYSTQCECRDPANHENRKRIKYG
jgi:hypothetical protein